MNPSWFPITLCNLETVSPRTVGYFRVDIFGNATCTCPCALTGGIPYDGWSEGMVVAEVTKGYQMPKPDHVDNKL